MDLRENRPTWPVGEVLKLSWPASLALMNTQIIRFVDGYMVSHVSHEAFAAQFGGGMLAFAPEAFAMGVLSVVSTYVSQNFGAGRFRRAGQYAWAGIFMSLAMAAMMALFVPLAGGVFSAMKHAPEVQGLEAMYFRYMILAAFLTLPTRVLEQFFYGIHRSRVVLAGTLISNVVNVVANYVLIFGHFGFPAMGLEGAALGSVISWAVQLVFVACMFVAGAQRRVYGTHMPQAVRAGQCKELLRIGWPAGVQFSNDIFCWGLFTTVLVGTFFGDLHMAATTTVMRYLGLSFMPAAGIGLAVTALVGKHIGRSDPDAARRCVRTGVVIAVAYMSACGLAFWLFRYPMIRFLLANVPSGPGSAPENIDLVVAFAASVMICAAIFQPLDAVCIVYTGALRGAGDTHWPMVATLVMNWSIVIGGGCLMVWLLPQWGSVGPWITASAFVILLGVVMAWRFESGAWRKIDLLGRTDRQQATGSRQQGLEERRDSP